MRYLIMLYYLWVTKFLPEFTRLLFCLQGFYWYNNGLWFDIITGAIQDKILFRRFFMVDNVATDAYDDESSM